MIETDGVPDLVHERVAQIIDAQIAVKANLPAHFWIEANKRLIDLRDGIFVGWNGKCCRRAVAGPAQCFVFRPL